MEMNDSTTLPCGRDPLDVIDAELAGRRDPHVANCVHCQGVLDGVAVQERIANELRSAASPAPPTLLPSVMATVWAELRPGREIPLPTETSSFASELAVTSALQFALEKLPHLEIQVCRVRLADTDETTATGAGPLLNVEVTAAAAYQTDLLALADSIRSHSTNTLAAQFGLAAAVIDVDITDLYDPRETS